MGQDLAHGDIVRPWLKQNRVSGIEIGTSYSGQGQGGACPRPFSIMDRAVVFNRTDNKVHGPAAESQYHREM